MVGTRRRAQEAPAADPAELTDSSSDDEAPEEVTLAVGKQSAEQRRREEAEAKAAASAAAKERRAAAAGRRAAAAEQEAQQQAAGDSEDEDDEEAAEGSEEEEEGEEGLDLLPDEVLAALASNKRTQPTAEQKRLISEQLRRQREPGQPLAVLGPRRTQLSEVEAGPVVVRVLAGDQPNQPSQSARDFLQQRLMAGVKRSADMLKPVRALQPPSLAQRQAQHLAVLHAQRPKAAPQAKRRR